MARRAARRVHRHTPRLIRVDADGSVVRGRPHRLECAVSNLAENAAKFDARSAGETEDAEPVRLEIRTGRVAVSDHGHDIGAADATRVFDRFHRVGSARGLPGSGLGLAIVRDVAETHDGTVFARSRPGGGAEVGFRVGGRGLLPPG
ncbi:sensor histidine kinase [Streptomyces sp. NPDC090493]|uniref:sensor histidine kinase n=1 Tax=Streptomyces sp. NPDC090493 TaxID=3365964 RepID=UPI0038245735